MRDAEQAYLHARVDGPGRAPTWVELPMKWRPDSWFEDDARSIPKFRRPMCRLAEGLAWPPGC